MKGKKFDKFDAFAVVFVYRRPEKSTLPTCVRPCDCRVAGLVNNIKPEIRRRWEDGLHGHAYYKNHTLRVCMYIIIIIIFIRRISSAVYNIPYLLWIHLFYKYIIYIYIAGSRGELHDSHYGNTCTHA